MNYMQPHGDIFVAKITGSGPVNADGNTPLAWTEQRFDPASSKYVDAEIGRRSTAVETPAYDLNGGSLATGNSYVFLRLRGKVNVPASGAYAGSTGLVYDVLGTAGTANFSGAYLPLGKAFPVDLNPLDLVPMDTGGYFNPVFPNRIQIPSNGNFLVTCSGYVSSGGFINTGKSTYSLTVTLQAVAPGFGSGGIGLTRLVADVSDSSSLAPFCFLAIVGNTGSTTWVELQVNFGAGILTTDKIAASGVVFIQKLS